MTTPAEDPRLEPDELAALAAVATGATHRAACRMLGVSERTMRRRLAEAVEKLGATCATNAMFLATEQRLVTSDLVAAAQRGEMRGWSRASRAAAAVSQERKRARLDAYAEHRRDGHGPGKAADLVGITNPATGREYEQAYLDGGGEPFVAVVPESSSIDAEALGEYGQLRSRGATSAAAAKAVGLPAKGRRGYEDAWMEMQRRKIHRYIGRAG